MLRYQCYRFLRFHPKYNNFYGLVPYCEFPMSTMSQQKARAELRANFLYALCELNGEPCDITTFERTKLSGTFKGWKTDGNEILVQGLQTPTGQNMNTALMRTSDIISVEFSKDIKLPAPRKVKIRPCSEDVRGCLG